MYLPWVLWSDGANFDSIEAGSLWSADQVAFNYDDPDISEFYLMLMSWNDHENCVKRLAYPATVTAIRGACRTPAHGHADLPEYYYLTGDMRAREAVVNLGQRARAILWKFNHDDKKDGTGPMPGPVDWCKKRDADTDRDFRLDTRYIGWPLFDLANAYRLTGDPQVLAECRNVAHAFRNTARYSPIGFMTLTVPPKGGTKNLYAFQGPFEKYRDQSASQCYAHFRWH